ncbi:hypothetical protein BD413DRAFT_265849 [Trametes elegans]|nr:hypothetical protein BD413DRAFT_265849 [Trametes elegans]
MCVCVAWCRMKIKKLPNVLALHLKRFKYQEDVGKYIKLTYRVAFPLELRLFNTVDDAEDPDRLYELFAIVVHIGTGPHHGHYVTIIKARGTWFLFDDDSVTTIKESEIPKYFGDSNSGSAYVLYYQAVDLDLTSLGLKPPPPPPSATASTDVGSAPGKELSVSTADPSEQSCAPGSPIPAMPPGLTEEPDSDKSDSPVPTTPSTQPIPLSPSNTPKHPSAPVPPNLVVSIPPSGVSSPPPVPASPSQPQHNHSLGGLFHSLRQSPSIRLRSNGFGSNHSENRKSAHDSSGFPLPSLPYSPSSRRPRTAQSTTSTADTSHQTHETIPSLPGSPIPSKGHAFPNGTPTPKEKERHPERKPSAWFKRKSSRQDNIGSSSPILPLSPIVPSASDGPSSPLASSSAHKKSSPDLARSVKREKRGAGKLPPRPSTAGARIGGTYESNSRPNSMASPPPLPPLPGSPISPGANGSATAVPTKGKDRENGGHSPGATDASGDEPRPNRSSPGLSPPSKSQSQSSSNASLPRQDQYPFTSSTGSGLVGLGFSGNSGGGSVADTPVVPPSSSTGSGSSSAGGNWRRATRKLSFTAPMLGLGRRDKDKDRHRDKPPPSFAR